MQSTPMGTERQDYTRLIRQTLLAALSSTFAVVLFIRTALELSFLTTIVIPFFLVVNNFFTKFSHHYCDVTMKALFKGYLY